MMTNQPIATSSANNHDDDQFQRNQDNQGQDQTTMQSSQVQNIPKLNDSVKGILLVNAFCLTNSALQIFGKFVVSMEVKAFDLAFFRSVIALIIAIPIVPMLQLRFCADVPRVSYKPMFFRSVSGALDYPFLCLAMLYLPITITAIIIGTSPFWASMIAYFVLGDRVRLIEKLAMVGSFLGIILITIAGSNTDEEQQNDQNDEEASFGQTVFALGFAVLSAVCIGFITVMNRQMRDISSVLILFHSSWIGMVVQAIILSGIAIANDSMPNWAYSTQQWLGILIASLIGTLSILLRNLANQYVKPTTFGILSNIMVVYNLMADLFIFDETFATLQVIGAVGILTFNFVVMYDSYKRSQKVQQQISELDQKLLQEDKYINATAAENKSKSIN